MQSNLSDEVFTLLRESQRKSSQAAHVKAGCGVHALNVAGRDEIEVWPSDNNFLLSREDAGRAIATLLVYLCAVELHNLPVVHVPAKGHLYGLWIGSQTVRGDL